MSSFNTLENSERFRNKVTRSQSFQNNSSLSLSDIQEADDELEETFINLEDQAMSGRTFGPGLLKLVIFFLGVVTPTLIFDRKKLLYSCIIGMRRSWNEHSFWRIIKKGSWKRDFNHAGSTFDHNSRSNS